MTKEEAMFGTYDSLHSEFEKVQAERDQLRGQRDGLLETVASLRKELVTMGEMALESQRFRDEKIDQLRAEVERLKAGMHALSKALDQETADLEAADLQIDELKKQLLALS